MKNSIKKNIDNKNSVLITLHGIGTYGLWQESLRNTINKHSSDFLYYKMQYGYLSPLRASIPSLRRKIIEKNNQHLNNIITKNQDKNIHIIAHSFGTYAILEYLLKNNVHTNIKTLILAGSIVKPDYLKKLDSGILKNINTFINDCGQSDKNLLITKLCIMNFGDAGRSGFLVDKKNNITNRFFKGGHKLYFKKYFYEHHWLPYLLKVQKVEPVDERKFGRYENFIEFFYVNLARLKYIWYVPAMILITLYTILNIRK